MNAYSVVAVIPLAWPEDLISQTLAAAGDVARRGASPLSVLALGSAVNDRVLALAGQAQADKLVWLLHPALAEAENLVALSEAAAAHLKTDQHLLLMLPAGADGEELAGQLAAQLDATCLGRCAAIELGSAHVGFERDAWGGRIALAGTTDDGRVVASVRAASLPADAAADGVRVVQEIVQLDAELPPLMACEQSESGQRLPPVDSSRIVVSGGRGVNEKGFELLESLALKLGGSLGGSLPAVDAGMVPVVRQVGVSGKFVSPDVYLAVGISGTPQHLAGISTDTRIVAINRDPDAEIFKVADLGVVAEWEDLLPRLLAN